MILILDKSEHIIGSLNNDAPNACPYFDDVLSITLDNAYAKYVFSTPLDHPSNMAGLISEDGYIIRPDQDGNMVQFQIAMIDDESSAGSVRTVSCEMVSIELAGKLIRPATWEGVNASQAMSNALANTRWVVGKVDWVGTNTFEITEHRTVLAMVHEIAKAYNAELVFRTETIGNKVSRRVVDILVKRGKNIGTRFDIDYSIASIKRSVDRRGAVSSLIGMGAGDANGKRLSFANVVWQKSSGDPVDKPFGQDWVGDPEALKQWGLDYNGEKIHLEGTYESETSSASRLLRETWDELQIRKNGLMMYELDAVLLGEQIGVNHEDIRIGDTVVTSDTTITPSITISARIINMDVSFSDPSKNKVAMGNYQPLFTNTDKILKSMKSKLIQYAGVWESGENIAKGPTPPENPEPNQLWIDTSGANGDVWKRWDELLSVWVEGPSGPDGQSLYTWIKYADTAEGVGISDSPAGKKYLGISYNRETPTESNTPSDYTWSLIEGPQGPSGEPTYTWVKYADDAAGTGLSDSPVGKLYMGIAHNKTTAVESTDSADYIWSLIKGDTGPQGPEGPQGIQGPTGPNGQTLYTWLKYADTPTTGMSDSPTGKAYIGLAYNKTVATESSTYSDYSWSLVKGEQGVAGPVGTDGTTYYTWIKYADTVTGTGMSDSPTGKDYIGLAYNKTSATESLTASDYQWALIKGDTGATGPQGPAGELNLVTNPHISGNASGWDNGAYGTTAFVDGRTVGVLNLTTAGNMMSQSSMFSIEPQKMYEFSVWLKQGTTKAANYFGFYVYDKAGSVNLGAHAINAYTGVKSTGLNTNPYFMTNDTLTAGVWVKYTAYMIPAGIDTSDVELFKGLGDNIGYLYQFPADAAKARMRVLNYSNTTTTTLTMAFPTVKEVDISVLQANKAKNEAIRTGTLVDGWTYTGTVQIDGGKLRADTVDAAVLKAGTVIAGNIKFTGILEGATGKFDGEVTVGNTQDYIHLKKGQNIAGLYAESSSTGTYKAVIVDPLDVMLCYGSTWSAISQGVNYLTFSHSDPTVTTTAEFEHSILQANTIKSALTGGLQFSSYGGIINMTDTTWIRFNKQIYTGSNQIRTDGLLVLNANTSLSGNTDRSLRVSNTNGYVDIGAKNTSYAHYYTDRPAHYFDKTIQSAGSLVAGAYVQADDIRPTTSTAGSIQLSSTAGVSILGTTGVQAWRFYDIPADLGHKVIAAPKGLIKILNSTTELIQFRKGDDSGLINIQALNVAVSSLRSLKKNIEPYTVDALNEVSTTPVYSYHMLEDGDNEMKRTGLIYDEVPADIADISGNGVSLYAMGAVMWRAIQQLNGKVIALEDKVSLLEGKINELGAA